jgi:hypothetical protein
LRVGALFVSSSLACIEFEVKLDAIANAVVFKCDDVFKGALSLPLEHNLMRLSANVSSNKLFKVS